MYVCIYIYTYIYKSENYFLLCRVGLQGRKASQLVFVASRFKVVLNSQKLSPVLLVVIMEVRCPVLRLSIFVWRLPLL